MLPPNKGKGGLKDNFYNTLNFFVGACFFFFVGKYEDYIIFTF